MLIAPSVVPLQEAFVVVAEIDSAASLFFDADWLLEEETGCAMEKIPKGDAFHESSFWFNEGKTTGAASGSFQ